MISCPLVTTWPTLTMTDDCTRPAIGARSVRWSTAASALATRSRASSARRSASLELLRVVGQERLHGLVGVAVDHIEPR